MCFDACSPLRHSRACLPVTGLSGSIDENTGQHHRENAGSRVGWCAKPDTLWRMPEVIIEIAQGRTQDQKRALIKEITEAVVRTCSVPADAVTVIIHENPLTDKGKGGVPFSER